MSIKVMIADDHLMIREGIRQLLEFDGEIEVVAEAGDGYECLSILEHVVPDVLLLDINMPKKNGLDVLKEIKDNEKTFKILILTMYDEVEYLMKTMEIGVDGYVLKNSSSVELKTAIDTVINGGSYIQSDLIKNLNSHLSLKSDNEKKVKVLTKRETEVLILLAKGLFNKEIAEIMNISERTVKNHVSNIFKKIDVADRTQAAVFAIKNELIKI